jgi:hypothetical protein
MTIRELYKQCRDYGLLDYTINVDDSKRVEDEDKNSLLLTDGSDEIWVRVVYDK